MCADSLNGQTYQCEEGTVNSEIFARILFSRKVLSHICDLKNLRLGHDLPISVNDRVIVQNREDFIFTEVS